jgi:hypothetical protein
MPAVVDDRGGRIALEDDDFQLLILRLRCCGLGSLECVCRLWRKDEERTEEGECASLGGQIRTERAVHAYLLSSRSTHWRCDGRGEAAAASSWGSGVRIGGLFGNVQAGEICVVTPGADGLSALLCTQSTQYAN